MADIANEGALQFLNSLRARRKPSDTDRMRTALQLIASLPVLDDNDARNAAALSLAVRAAKEAISP